MSSEDKRLLDSSNRPFGMRMRYLSPISWRIFIFMPRLTAPLDILNIKSLVMVEINNIEQVSSILSFDG